MARQVAVGHGGATLVEALVVIAISAILAALAVPSFKSSMDNKRITAAAEAVLVDLRLARSEAIARNKTVRVTFTTGSTWSYTLNVDPTGSNTLLKTGKGGDYLSTTLASAAFSDDNGDSFTYTNFGPARVNNPYKGKVSLQSLYHSAEVSVSALGRVRICGNMTGYSPC